MVGHPQLTSLALGLDQDNFTRLDDHCPKEEFSRFLASFELSQNAVILLKKKEKAIYCWPVLDQLFLRGSMLNHFSGHSDGELSINCW